VRIESLYLRARSALAAVADPSIAASRRAALIGFAESDAAKLGREGAAWGRALAHLILSGASTVRANTGEAITRLQEAEAVFENIDMCLHAAVARRRRGQLLGGVPGELLVMQADGWMRTQAIRNPARIAAMLAPGAFTS
jgi:eukaryotic-like serine/threonine-protein kinase